MSDTKEESVRIVGVLWEIEQLLNPPHTTEKVLQACGLAKTIPVNRVVSITDFIRDWIACGEFDPTEIVHIWRKDPMTLHPLVQSLPYWLADASPFMDDHTYFEFSDVMDKDAEKQALVHRIGEVIGNIEDRGQLRELLHQLETEV